MYRGNAVLIVCFALILVVRSDEPIRCYKCTSVTNPGCETDPMAYNIETEVCTGKRLRDWVESTFKQHEILSRIEPIFTIDDPHLPSTVPMACAKMILKVDKQEVIMRSCQMANTETIDQCKAIEGKAKLHVPVTTVQYCDLCETDLCNGSAALSPTVLLALSSVLAAAAIANLYDTA